MNRKVLVGVVGALMAAGAARGEVVITKLGTGTAISKPFVVRIVEDRSGQALSTAVRFVAKPDAAVQLMQPAAIAAPALPLMTSGDMAASMRFEGAMASAR
jgi:hypothetical protein